MTRAIILFLSLFGLAAPAFAQGKAIDWQLGLQGAASPVADKLHDFHFLLLVIITAIVIFVLGLLLYVILRFNKRANPVPSKTAHNTMIEIIWTAVPVIILFIIAVPSIKALYYMDKVTDPELTVKVTGYQWNWGYEYPDLGVDEYISVMLWGNEFDQKMVDLRKQQNDYMRLLSVDYPLVLPVETDIQILVTAGDVLHSFAMPSMGIKLDAVPGRLNETWVHIKEPGTYYGQCSELCGKDHTYMPIEIKALEKEKFDKWSEIAADQGVDAANAQILNLKY